MAVEGLPRLVLLEHEPLKAEVTQLGLVCVRLCKCLYTANRG